MPLEDAGAEPVETSTVDTTTPDLSGVKAHDDMGDTVRELYRKMGSPGNEGNQPVHRPVQAAKTNDRGTDGKFKKAEGTPATEKKPETAPKEEEPEKTANDEVPDKVPAEETAEAETKEEKPAEAAKPLTDADKAPTSWKASAQAKFAGLDAEVKAEIHRREADFHKGLGEYKTLANIGKLLHAEIAPYEAMIREYKMTPQQVIRGLMATAQQLRSGTQAQKIQIMRNMAREYNVDIPAIVPTEAELAAMAAQPQPDPEVPRLREELQRRDEQLKQLNDQQIESIRAEADAFARAPGHEHYEEVKLDMAALLETGRAKTLQEAYDNAIYANPTVRAKLNAQQQEAERKRAAEKAAAAKKAASTNVSTRGSLPTTPTVKGTTMDETIRNTLKAIRARNGAS